MNLKAKYLSLYVMHWFFESLGRSGYFNYLYPFHDFTPTSSRPTLPTLSLSSPPLHPTPVHFRLLGVPRTFTSKFFPVFPIFFQTRRGSSFIIPAARCIWLQGVSLRQFREYQGSPNIQSEDSGYS